MIKLIWMDMIRQGQKEGKTAEEIIKILTEYGDSEEARITREFGGKIRPVSKKEPEPDEQLQQGQSI